MENKKVIIWGHKNNGHTHSYIHKSYYKAFQYLGYETYFFEDGDIGQLSGFNFENCIFFTEDQVQKNIPLVKSSKYILHHTNLEKYNDAGISYIQLGNYLRYCEDGVSGYYKNDTVERIDSCSFWDDKNKIIYQPWGTDLLPHEIDLEEPLIFDPSRKDIFYIGTLYEDLHSKFQTIRESVQKLGLSFRISTNLSYEDNRKEIKDSLISFDVRNDWHQECGYLPCRIFKNTSYGRFTTTNSQYVKNILGDFVHYEPDLNYIIESSIDAQSKTDRKLITDSMNFIKENHTYVNRIKNLIQLL